MALQESLLAHDGITPGTLLTTSLLEEFGNDPPKMVAFTNRAKPGDYGRFAPRVFEFASTGDRTALRIVTQSAGWIDAALDRVSEITGGGRLCLLGGLAAPYAPFLSPRHRDRLVQPVADALTGAIALAASAFAEQREMAG
jgi:glucosamine kinase